MAKEIIMPKFGFTQDESTIVAWLKEEGDEVEKGEPIAECTTDKVDMEIEAPEDGILGGIRYGVGETVPVTEIIAWVLKEGEEAPAAPEAAAPAKAAPEQEATAEAPAANAPAADTSQPATPVARRLAQAEGVDLAAVVGSGSGGKITREDVERYIESNEAAADNGKVRATPAARRVAAEHGLDLADIEGTGPRGRVQEADALAAAQAAQTAQPAAARPAPAPAFVPSGEPQVIPVEGMRKTIADRMQQSYQQAPHVTFVADVDMTKAIAFRQYANDRLPEGQTRVSMTAVIMKAVAWALRQHPMVNSYLVKDEIFVMPEVNLGMAVALEDGLIVPVIHNADQKGLYQIAQEVVDLSQRARSNSLRPTDVSDGTFTVSNLGMFGIDQFTAIINPPQVGILAVGRTAKRFVPDENDQPVAKPMMTITLVTDHRVIDGAQSAQFVATLREALEEPASALL